MGLSENKFNDESEEERSDRDDSPSSIPSTPERRPPIGAPRDYRKRDLIPKKEEEDDIPMDEL
eukprot:9094571-Karenia_brevis.AAC.1